jgi:DNA mismatch repair protein MutS2
LPLRLDLRGKRADVALNELGAFLDKALLANIEGTEIVHGRGTGVLRREVHNFLRSFPGIASFALAPEEQGGDGMTMVTFK